MNIELLRNSPSVPCRTADPIGAWKAGQRMYALLKGVAGADETLDPTMMSYSTMLGGFRSIEGL